MRKIFEDWELEYIRDNYQTKTYQEITDYLNLHNKVKKDAKQVRTKSSVLGYRKQNIGIKRDYFNVIDTEEKAYWLGFIYADGYVSISKTGGQQEVGIELNVNDIGHLRKFDKALNGNLPIAIRTRKPTLIKGVPTGEREVCSIRIYSKKMVSDLIKHGVTIRKTYSKEFPIVEDGLFFHFLRGFFDGDGCITLSQNGNIDELKFTNPNNEFLKFISNKLLENGIHTTIYCEDELKYNLRISTFDRFKFLDKIYGNSNVFLDRKYQKYKDAVLNRDI